MFQSTLTMTHYTGIVIEVWNNIPTFLCFYSCPITFRNITIDIMFSQSDFVVFLSFVHYNSSNYGSNNNSINPILYIKRLRQVWASYVDISYRQHCVKRISLRTVLALLVKNYEKKGV